MEQISTIVEEIEKVIADHQYGQKPKELYEPIEYIMQLGGKRLRPAMALATAEIFGANRQDVILPIIGIEVFHNFTLVHDDIMDKAPMRRGQSTVHEKWNANVAILSGDVMLIKAYELLLKSPPTLLPSILSKFNQCACEVCEGQQMDMNFEVRQDVTTLEYIEMIKLKTAVLLGFSLEMGAILGGSSDANATLLRDFGTNIGIGFQLKDDFLDVYGDQAKFGKQVGGDIISNKKTFLLIEALAKVEGEQAQELQKWIDLEEFNPEEKVAAVTSIYNDLKIDQLTRNKMNEYFDLAMFQLESLQIEEEKKLPLQQFAHYLINREE